jgi:secondary thiamine-phosphate synthase enzyme
VPEELGEHETVLKTIELSTRSKSEMINITSKIRDIVHESGVLTGICTVFCPHTTAAITINENADPDVVSDLLMGLDRLVPESWPFRHGEGNSDAHLKSSLVGTSEQVFIEKGNLVLGTWQGLYFCEFDGPRHRNVHIQIINEVKVSRE